MRLTLAEYKKRRIRKSRPIKFRGWVHIHSRTGSDWSDWGKWLVISGPYEKKKAATQAMMEYRHDDCCPCNVVEIYY